MIIELIALVGLVLFCFYKFATKNDDFFVGKNVPFEKPFPLLGNMKDMVFRKRSMVDIIIHLYNKFDTKVFGVFDQRNPVFAMKHPDLIKQVTVKDFDHFVNHRTVFSDTDGGLFGNSLFSMRDQKWRDMRATLSPAFTGSKMRMMFQLIQEVSEGAINFLKNNKNGLDNVDLKDYFTRYTNDVIATTAFGIKVDSLKNKDNEFYKMGKNLTGFTFWRNIKFLLFINFKAVFKLLRIELFDKKSSDYLNRLVLDAIKYRADNHIIRPDMINMLMEAQGIIKNEDSPKVVRDWSDEEIVAQCFIFFFAGFETASVLLCFAAHELMENPDVQNKLRQEINEVKESLNGKTLTYDALMGMKYMDMVVSETLRKWPPAPFNDRQCSKTFRIKDEDTDVTINVGDSVWIPVVGLHRDPQYYPEPDVFDPERFSDANKSNIKPFTYIPFGLGPRNCIGSRFALLEAKAILFYLLSEFEILKSEKTMSPLVLDPRNFQLIPKGGFWLKFKEIKK